VTGGVQLAEEAIGLRKPSHSPMTLPAGPYEKAVIGPKALLRAAIAPSRSTGPLGGVTYVGVPASPPYHVPK
jgi:hypothetical protein